LKIYNSTLSAWVIT